MSAVAALAPGAAWCLTVLVCRLCHCRAVSDIDMPAALCALWLLFGAPASVYFAIVLRKFVLTDEGAASVLVLTMLSWTCMSWFTLASLASI